MSAASSALEHGAHDVLPSMNVGNWPPAGMPGRSAASAATMPGSVTWT